MRVFQMKQKTPPFFLVGYNEIIIIIIEKNAIKMIIKAIFIILIEQFFFDMSSI